MQMIPKHFVQKRPTELTYNQLLLQLCKISVSDSVLRKYFFP